MNFKEIKALDIVVICLRVLQIQKINPHFRGEVQIYKDYIVKI